MAGLWLPDAPPASAGADDDEFADNSGGVPGGWTEVDHGSVLTVTEDQAGLSLLASNATGQIAGIYKSIPAGNLTAWTKVSLSGLGVQNYVLGGLALWIDATTTTADIITWQLITSSTETMLQLSYYSAYNTFSFEYTSALIGQPLGQTHMYLRVRRNTTWSWDYSFDGVTWFSKYTGESFSATHYGPFVNSSSSGAAVRARFPFFRYVASDVGVTGLVGGDRVTFPGGAGGGGGGGGGMNSSLILTGVG